jgi:hypothetical protein
MQQARNQANPGNGELESLGSAVQGSSLQVERYDDSK